VTLACEAQGYAFISQEVNTIIGGTYAFSFSYSNLQFGQQKYVDGIEAQIQVLLDGHIVSAFAALTNDWQASTIVLVAALDYSLVEVRLICPAQNNEGIEDDSPFPSIFEAGFAQFSLSVTNASVTISPLAPEGLLGTEDLLQNPEFQQGLENWQNSSKGSAFITTSSPGYGDDVSVLAYCRSNASVPSQATLLQEIATLSTGLYEFTYWYRQDQYSGSSDTDGTYTSFSTSSTTDASPLVQIWPRSSQDSTGARPGQWNKISGSFTASDDFTSIIWQIACPQDEEELYVRVDAFDVLLSSDQPACDEQPAPTSDLCISYSGNLITNGDFATYSVLCQDFLCWTTQGNVSIVSPGAGDSIYAVKLSPDGGQQTQLFYQTVEISPYISYSISFDYYIDPSSSQDDCSSALSIHMDGQPIFPPIDAFSTDWTHSEIAYMVLYSYESDFYLNLDEDCTMLVDNVAVIQQNIDNSVFINNTENLAQVSCGLGDPDSAYIEESFPSVPGQVYSVSFVYLWQVSNGQSSQTTANFFGGVSESLSLIEDLEQGDGQ